MNMKFEKKELKRLCRESFAYLTNHVDELSEENNTRLKNALPFYTLALLFESSIDFDKSMEKTNLKFKSESDEKYIKDLFNKFNSLFTNKDKLLKHLYTMAAGYVNDIISNLLSKDPKKYSKEFNEEFIDLHSLYMIHRMREMP